jgi:hypothetical protein
MSPAANLFRIFAATLILTGCNDNSITRSEPAEPVIAVVRSQVDALNREDLAGALAVVDPESPGFAQTKDMCAKLFQAYDLRYKLSDVAVISATDTEARVRFTQVTEKIAGPAFRNNRLEGIHTLKKRAGQWKLFGTETSKIEFLDK